MKISIEVAYLFLPTASVMQSNHDFYEKQRVISLLKAKRFKLIEVKQNSDIHKITGWLILGTPNIDEVLGFVG